jgi:hypothetical protein
MWRVPVGTVRKDGQGRGFISVIFSASSTVTPVFAAHHHPQLGQSRPIHSGKGPSIVSTSWSPQTGQGRGLGGRGAVIGCTLGIAEALQ